MLIKIAEIGQRVARAVGGGLLALDLFETENGLTVNEVKRTMGSRISIAATSVSIHKKIWDDPSKDRCFMTKIGID